MKKAVCIIDDDDDIRDVMTYALESEGFVVLAFANPIEALDSLAAMSLENLPGFIMIDFHMPRMNGLSVVETIMNHHASTLGRVPLAICSAEDDLANAQNFPKDVIHLNKPLELDHFVNTVRGFCG